MNADKLSCCNREAINTTLCRVSWLLAGLAVGFIVIAIAFSIAMVRFLLGDAVLSFMLCGIVLVLCVCVAIWLAHDLVMLSFKVLDIMAKSQEGQTECIKTEQEEERHDKAAAERHCHEVVLKFMEGYFNTETARK